MSQHSLSLKLTLSVSDGTGTALSLFHDMNCLILTTTPCSRQVNNNLYYSYCAGENKAQIGSEMAQGHRAMHGGTGIPNQAVWFQPTPPPQQTANQARHRDKQD